MRRRRRQKNPLLGRMILIAFGITLLLLPVLAKMGAFKAVKEGYMEVTLVKEPPPPPVPKTATAKKARPRAQQHHGSPIRGGGSRTPLPVHVAAATGPATGDSSADNSIVNGSGSDIGQPPSLATATPAPPIAPAPPPPPPPPVAVPAPPIAVPTPQVAPDQPAEVIAETQVKPVIPDELRDSDLDTQFRALFTVHADGSTDVKMVTSTGNNELDQLALQAARQWRFRPALHAGKPADSYIRLVVEFQVS